MKNLNKEGIYYLEPGKSPMQLTKKQVKIFKAIFSNDKELKDYFEPFSEKDEEIKKLIKRNLELLERNKKIDKLVIEMAGQLDKMLGSIHDLTLKS